MPYGALGLVLVVVLVGVIVTLRPDVLDEWRRERDEARRR